MKTKIVITGCSVGGIETALRLNKKVDDNVEIVAVHSDGFFTYRPWIKEVFRGKDESDVAVNLDFLFSDNGIEFIESEVQDINLNNKELILADGEESFDFLVYSKPQVTNFDNSNLMQYLTAKDSEVIKENIKDSLSDPDDADLTITVCGGGPAGVELASELNEFLDDCCKGLDVRRIDVELVLVEEKNRLLPEFPSKAGEIAHTHLSREGIDVRLNSKVEEVREEQVVLDSDSFRSSNVIWCGGVKPEGVLSDHKLHTDGDGRVMVNPYLQSVNEATIYALGQAGRARHVKYKGPELSSLGHSVREAKLVAHNLASIMNEGEKKYFEFKKTPMWISLGRGKSIFVWKDFVTEGKLADMFGSFRNKRYSKRWK